MIGGVVLDASAVRDIASGRTVYGQAFTAAALAEGLVMLIPAPVLYEAWVTVPEGAFATLELLVGRSVVVVEALDQVRAHDAARRVRQAPRAAEAVALAHVVHAARTRGWRVLTAEPERLWELDVDLAVETLPTE